MCKKLSFLISLALALGLAGNASADAIDWTDAGSDHLWSNADNWAGGTVPGAGNSDGAIINYILGGTGPTVQAGDNFGTWDMDVGTQAGDVTMTMTGGTIWGAGHFGFAVHSDSNCTLNMSGGIIRFGELMHIGGGEGGGAGGVAIIAMDGGTIYQENPSSNFRITGSPGLVELNDGLIDVYNFDISGGGHLNIETGTLIIHGDKRDYINGKVSEDKITAYDGADNVYVHFDGTYTTVMAESMLPLQAWGQYPSDAGTSNRVKPILSWAPGILASDANGHNVYFGTAPDALTLISERQDANSFSVSEILEFGKTYYWQVDEYNDTELSSPWEGETWSFTTKVGPMYLQAGDLNWDYRVNWKDLVLLTERWVDTDCFSPDCKADIDGIDGVNSDDFVLQADNWRQTKYPGIDDEQVGYVIGGVPEEMWPTKPTVSWDLCGPLCTKADCAAKADCVKEMNFRGVPYMAYWGLGHIESSSSQEELIAEFAEFNLEPDGRKVDIDGNIVGGDFGSWVVSTQSRAWLETCVQVFKNMIDVNVVAVGVDEGWGSSGPWRSNDYHPEALAGFRDFLRDNYTDEELEDMGVDDVNTYDYRIAKKYTVPDWLMDEIDEVWTWYCHGHVAEFQNELIQRTKTHAASQGKDWHVYINNYVDLGDWANLWKVAKYSDIIFGELFPIEDEFPDGHMTSFYKNVRSLGKRFFPQLWFGHISPPLNDPNSGVLPTFTAELCVNGCIGVYPDDPDTPGILPSIKAKFGPYFTFVRSNEELFTDPDSEIGLMYSLSNCAGELKREGFYAGDGVGADDYHGAARLLEDAHRSYDVVFAGNDTWVPYDLTLEDLQQYKLIVLAKVKYMSEPQRQLILDYVSNGGVIMAMGDIGTHDIYGNAHPSSEWNTLFAKDGLHSYGNGKIYHFADISGQSLTERYGHLGGGSPADLNLFASELNSLVPPRLVTDLPITTAVHRNAFPSEDGVILHLLNYDYDWDQDIVTPVANASMTITVPVSLQSGDLDVTYYELTNLPAGQSLSYSRSDDEVMVTIIHNIDNWGTLVIQKSD